MLWKLKVGASIAILIVSLVWMCQDLIGHFWWQALGTLMAGVIVAFAVHAITEDNAPWVLTPMVFVFGIAGWLHLTQKSPFLDTARQRGLQSLSAAFLNLLSTNGLSQFEQHVVWMGIAGCSSQPTRDALVTTTDAMKTLYESPAMSIADRASGAGKLPPSPERCIEAYRQLRPQMPWAFAQAEKESPWLLQQLQAQ